MNAIQKAIKAAGGQKALGEKLSPKLTQQAISDWLRRGIVPAERVLQVEAATNGQVTRHELRPDLYPKEGAEQAA